MRYGYWSFVALVALALPGALDASILYTNLAFGGGGGTFLDSSTWVANSFSTDNNSYILSDVIVPLEGVSTTGMVTVSLYSDNGNAPGTDLATIGTVQDSDLSATGFTQETLTPSGPITLNPNTLYFIVLSGSTSGSSDAEWERANNLNGTGILNQFYGVTNNSGQNWSTFGDINGDHPPYVMQVDTAPEPGTVFGALGGLAALLAARLRRRV